MYAFIRLQYLMGRLSVEQVLAFVPKWITEDEAATILGQ